MPVHERRSRPRSEPLDKVTVTELARDCGLTRQAFYYHFPDVRHLAAWVFETEVAGEVRASAAEEGWADGLVRLMLYMRGNRSSTLGGAQRGGPARARAFPVSADAAHH
jgi:AcrR family transcriptional regulator